METERPDIWDEIPALKDKEPRTEEPRPVIDPDPGETHNWMLASENGVYDPVETATKLQEGVESLPKTSATFRLNRILDDIAVIKHTVDEVVELAGAWPLPDEFTEDRQSGRRYVNPNYPHARYYSEVVTRCRCGAVMIREEKVRGGQIAANEHDHADSCPKDYRLHARARLAEKRRRVIKRVLYLGMSVRSAQARIGLRRDSLANEAEQLALPPIGEMKERSREVIANTWAVLLEDYSPNEVAPAYGCSGQKVRRYVDKYTDAKPGELYKLRRDNGW